MNKTQELIAAIKAGTHRITNEGFVQRRLTKDHAFSGARAGEWVTSSNWRKDIVTRAAAIRANDPRINGCNVEFLGAQPAKCGQDY
jgi:hypothetical protein